jgi:hypothetical protein
MTCHLACHRPLQPLLKSASTPDGLPTSPSRQLTGKSTPYLIIHSTRKTTPKLKRRFHINKKNHAKTKALFSQAMSCFFFPVFAGTPASLRFWSTLFKLLADGPLIIFSGFTALGW